MDYVFDKDDMKAQIDLLRKHMRIIVGMDSPVPEELHASHDMTVDTDAEAVEARKQREADAAIKVANVRASQGGASPVPSRAAGPSYNPDEVL